MFKALSRMGAQALKYAMTMELVDFKTDPKTLGACYVAWEKDARISKSRAGNATVFRESDHAFMFLSFTLHQSCFCWCAFYLFSPASSGRHQRRVLVGR